MNRAMELPASRALTAERRLQQRQLLEARVGGRPRRRLAVGVAVALAVLAAAPTLALQREHVDFWSAKPAATRFQVDFDGISKRSKRAAAEARRSGRGMTPVGPAREVLTVAIGGESQSVWVVPTEEGGFCHGLAFGMFCPGPEARDRGPVLGAGGLSTHNGGLDWIVGPAFDERVHAVEALYQDGTRDKLPYVWVSAPIDAGLFAYDFPPEHEQQGSLPVALLGLGAGGRTLVHQCLPVPPDQVERSVPEAAELCRRPREVNPPPPDDAPATP